MAELARSLRFSFALSICTSCEIMESEVEKASSPHTSDVPLSWLEYFPGEEFQLEDKRVMLIRNLLDFFQTSAARQILSQV